MPQRYQSQPLDRPIPIMPSAAPVDRMVQGVRPTEIEGQSTASQLAEALGQITPSITGFIKNQIADKDQLGAEQGRSMRLQTALNYKDAVDKGVISQAQNPFFVKAWKEQDGKVTADRYNADLTIAMATGPLAGTTDPTQIQPLLSTFRKNWTDANVTPDSQSNPSFMQGFEPQAGAYDSNALEHVTAEVGKRMVDQVDQNTHNEIYGILADGQTRGLSNEAMADGINQRLDALNLTSAMPYKVSNKVVLDELAEQAYTNKDMRVFGVANSIKTGGGYLGQTKAAMDIMRTTQDHIASSLAATDDHSHKMATWEREDTERTTQANINSLINSNDRQGRPTDLSDVADDLEKLNRVNPSAASSMRTQVLESGKPHAQTDNVNAVYSLEDSRWSGSLTSDQINAAFRSGQITQETSSKYHTALVDEADKHDAKALEAQKYATSQQRMDRPKDVAQIPAYQAMAKSITEAFGTGDPMKAYDPKQAQLSNSVLSAGRSQVMGFIKGHPNYTPEELYDATNRIGQSLIKQFSTPAMKSPQQTIDPLIEQAQAAARVNGIPAQRLYSSPDQWAKAKAELAPGSDLDKKLTDMKMTNAEKRAYIKAQDALYNTVPPKPNK